MVTNMKNFPLLNEIDEQNYIDNIDWNKNAFQTILTSNLPTKTIFYYTIDVGLRRLENSLYEVFWDSTADALNDLSHVLFNTLTDGEDEAYLYEAKCQFLMYASIAILKFNTIRRRSINEAKISCATIFLLLLEQSKSYETPRGKTEYLSCIHSMRCRYLKRIFIIGQWLPTLSPIQHNDIQTNHHRYIETITDQLFSVVTLRDKINKFIDNSLLHNNSNQESLPDDFVFIQQFPKYNEKNCNLSHVGMINTLNQYKYPLKKFTTCIWTLSCMIESNRISLRGFNDCIKRDDLSHSPIDFEQKPILNETLSEQDILVFLLLCAQQNTHLSDGESILHPYLLYLSSNLYTQSQKNWWLTAMKQTTWSEFLDHLAIIRLDQENINKFPPKLIVLQTANILFKAAQTAYEQRSNRLASSYEQYAIQYLETVKANLKNNNWNSISKIQEKTFFIFPKKYFHENKTAYQELINECEKLQRLCDELKLLPELEPEPEPSTTDETDVDKSSIQIEETETPSINVTSTVIDTLPKVTKHDVDVQTIEEISSSSSPSPPDLAIPLVEENIETPVPTFPPIVDKLFSHMNGVNQWINKFCITNDGIQNDINTIRDRLEKLNRATSQMIFSNVTMFQSNPNENIGQFYPPN